MRSTTAVVLALLASGCNELSFIPDQTVPAGTTISMPITLSLDPGVSARGLQSTVTVDAPLLLGACDVAHEMRWGTVALNSRSARLIMLPTEDADDWVGSQTLYTCAVTIPAGTPFGAYALRFHNAALSDGTGKELPLWSSGKGVLHVS